MGHVTCHFLEVLNIRNLNKQFSGFYDYFMDCIHDLASSLILIKTIWLRVKENCII